MSLKIDLAKPRELVSKPVVLGPGEEFHIMIRPPTFGEMVKDLGSFGTEYIRDRIQLVVCDWAGLVQDVQDAEGNTVEQPIPFSFENLMKVCEKYPQAFQQIAQHAASTFRTDDREKPKNARPSSVLFSADEVIRHMAPSLGAASGGSANSAGPQG